jgi:hypothetical protein
VHSLQSKIKHLNSNVEAQQQKREVPGHDNAADIGLIELDEIEKELKSKLPIKDIGCLREFDNELRDSSYFEKVVSICNYIVRSLKRNI